jgi:protein involved in polysaccharide export with SLBB domain
MREVECLIGRRRLDRMGVMRVALVLVGIWPSTNFARLAAQQAQTVAAEPEGQKVLDSSLMPGDAIRLAGTAEKEVPGEYTVDEAGTVVLPLLGSRNVSGVPTAALKRQLVEDYRRQLKNQDVQITMLRRVRVLGAVKNPGIYYVDPTMTVADAIALAGGATQQGKLKGVQVLRADKVIRSDVDVNAPVGKEMQSGDQVIVPERSWFARNGQYVIGGAIAALGVIVAQALSN